MTEDFTALGTSRRSRLPLVMYGIAAVLTAANPLLHKAVSDVADFFRAQWGFARYDLVSLIAIPVVSVAVSLPLVARRREFLRRPVIVAALVALAGMSAAAQHWLLVVNVELVHLPQFALIAAVLLRGGASGMTAFVLATLAGIVDETYQHLVIYADTPGTYFDVNDIVLNAIGAAWGVLLFGSSSSPERLSDKPSTRPTRVTWGMATAASVAVFAAAWWWDPPVFDPLFRTTNAHPFYRVLSAPEGVSVCGLLAWIVHVGWRSRQPGTDDASGNAAVAVQSMLVLVLMATAGCASAGRPPIATPSTAPRRAPETSFITTFWCGPPLDEFDDRRAQQIVDGGFSVVGPPCEGAITPDRNRRALEIAARHGLTLWVADPRFDLRARAQPGWEEALDAAVEDYRGFPALGAYFVTDEPSPAQFADLDAVVARLRMRDPDRLAYVNLNPDYVFGASAPTVYPVYVDRFITTVKPRLLSYDYYTFRVNEDRPTFFRSLALFREQSERHRIPFLFILLAMPHGSYRDPSEAEVAWQAYHALAYGAAGISYFAYWTPVQVAYADVLKFRHGLIESGEPTRHYHEAAALNLRLRTLAAELTSFRSVAVRDNQGEVADALPFGPLRGITGGPVTVGFFGRDDGQSIAMLVNRDYERERRVMLLVDRQAGRTEAFDVDTREWTRLRSNEIRLPAGGALLLTWRNTKITKNDF